MEITADLVKQNWPAVWWQIYREGFSTAVNDPNQQERAAKKHLERTLTKASSADPAAKASPPPLPMTQIDPVQAHINKQLGLDEATFQRFRNGR